MMWMFHIVLWLATSFAVSLSGGPQTCTFIADNCDTLVIADVVSVTETVVTVQNVGYLQGTACQMNTPDIDHGGVVQFQVNWSEMSACYNSTFLTVGRSYLFCSHKDKWKRCHLSADTPATLVPSHILSERNDVDLRIKRQNQGVLYQSSIHNINYLMCIFM